MINLKTFAIFCSTFSLSLGFSANFNANECRLELDAFSALSKSYGQQQIKIFKILRENSYLKNPNLNEQNKIEKAEDINTHNLYELMKICDPTSNNIYLLEAYTNLLTISHKVLEYRHQTELCFGKNARKESVDSYMKGYKEGSNMIKRAYGLDKL